MKKIDLGAGEFPAEGYEHLDIRKLPHIEYVNDVRKLPFEDNSIDKFRASHVLEHVMRRDVIPTLTEWYRCLKPEGTLEIFTPDLLATIKSIIIQASGHPITEFKDPHKLQQEDGVLPESFEQLLNDLYGSQANIHQYHLSAVSKKTLRESLYEAGFSYVVLNEEHNEAHAIAHKTTPKELPLQIWLRTANTEFNSQQIAFTELTRAIKKAGIDIIATDGNAPIPDNTEMCTEIWLGHAWTFDISKVTQSRVAITYHEAESFIMPHEQEIIRQSNMRKLLIFPSQWAARAWRTAPITTPIIIIPFGVNTAIFKPIARDFFEDPLVFLHYGAQQFRKGSWLVHEAFDVAFVGNKRVMLITHDSTNSTDFQILKEKYKNDPRHKFISTFYETKELPDKLLKHAHIIVSPSLSAAWDFCTTEAMSTGMPAIVPRHSVYLEFFKEDFGWFSDISTGYEPVNTVFADNPGYWRIPCRFSLANKMSEAFKDRASLKEKGKSASQYIKENLTWDYTAEQLITVLKEQL